MASLAESPAHRNGKSRDKAKVLRKTIDDRLEQLAKAVDDVRASELFRQYLDVQARFHKYSWHNTMLIATQKPDAERVAGFKTWTTMGRHVRKGERGIMIFAPRPFKRTETDDAGNETERQGVSFRPVYVFDVSQTDGDQPGARGRQARHCDQLHRTRRRILRRIQRRDNRHCNRTRHGPTGQNTRP